jgi:hypothetical protein
MHDQTEDSPVSIGNFLLRKIFGDMILASFDADLDDTMRFFSMAERDLSPWLAIRTNAILRKNNLANSYKV